MCVYIYIYTHIREREREPAWVKPRERAGHAARPVAGTDLSKYDYPQYCLNP